MKSHSDRPDAGGESQNNESFAYWRRKLDAPTIALPDSLRLVGRFINNIVIVIQSDSRTLKTLQSAANTERTLREIVADVPYCLNAMKQQLQTVGDPKLANKVAVAIEKADRIMPGIIDAIDRKNQSIALAMLPSDAQEAEFVAATLIELGDQLAAHAAVPAPPADAGVRAGNADAIDESRGAQGPALKRVEQRVLLAMNVFDSAKLVTISNVVDEIPRAKQLSDETIRKAVLRLIELGLSERPNGRRGGARLTTAGRRLAAKIED